MSHVAMDAQRLPPVSGGVWPTRKTGATLTKLGQECQRAPSRHQAKLAGMDGNRSHPGRLSSAPQTVLKTHGVVLNSEPAQKGH